MLLDYFFPSLSALKWICCEIILGYSGLYSVSSWKPPRVKNKQTLNNLFHCLTEQSKHLLGFWWGDSEHSSCFFPECIIGLIQSFISLMFASSV